MTTEPTAGDGPAHRPESAALPDGWVVTHVVETGSTNADLVAAAARRAAHGTVLVADHQRTGRGRLGRSWVAPAGTALLFSALVRLPRVPPARRGWIGAVLGLAIVAALRDRAGVAATLKWPNDVLIDGHKVAGILAEMAGDALVVGSGINITVAAADLPRADATSLLLAGADPLASTPDVLLPEILRRFAALLARWEDADGDVDASGIRGEYRSACATLGATVTVQLPDGTAVTGRAVDVAPDGAIGVESESGQGSLARYFSAGDVTHLRPAACD